MPHVSRRTFLELASATMISGCSGGRTSFAAGSAPLVAFSDVHFNPFWTNDAKVFQALDAADFTEWEGIFEACGPAPSIAGADTNYPLLKLALASVRQNLGDSRVVLYTGDLLGHEIATLYQQASGSSDQASMVAFTNKTAAFVMQQIRKAVGNIPVVFAVGNCDSYNDYGPDPTFLANTAEMFYSQMLNGTADHQEFVSTFKAGGYYSVELFDKRLMVIGLNTILCNSGVPPEPATVSEQFAWLDTKLAAARAAGQKVWIVMHVPLGGCLGPTAANYAASGRITGASMMWIGSYQLTFTETIVKYPGLISMMVAGHTHMDEYRIMMPGYVLEVAPGISPVFANDPAYKRFTLDLGTFAPGDYEAIKCGLGMPLSQFQSYYTFTDAYNAPNYSPESLERLFPKLASDPAMQALFRKYYYSGNTAGNTITNVNWPVFWAGVGTVAEQGIVDSANSYR